MSNILNNLLYVFSLFFLIIIFIIKLFHSENLNSIALYLLKIIPFYIIFHGPIIHLIYKKSKLGNIAKLMFTLLNIIIGVVYQS
jgi:hypothetical protein